MQAFCELCIVQHELELAIRRWPSFRLSSRGSFRHDSTPSPSTLIITICFLSNFFFFLHFCVPLGEESSCCPREHVARSLTMRREQSLRLLYLGVCYVSVPRRRPRKSIFPIAQPSSHRSSTRPRKQRPPSLSLVCLPPPYSTHKHAKSDPHSS